jgi:hypothetical protein
VTDHADEQNDYDDLWCGGHAIDHDWEIGYGERILLGSGPDLGSY